MTDEPDTQGAEHAPAGPLASRLAEARREYDAALAASAEAYEHLEASPESLEYQINWNVARRHEAAVAWRLSHLEEDE